jgi:superoxide dismutase, Cu-Zn family
MKVTFKSVLPLFFLLLSTTTLANTTTVPMSMTAAQGEGKSVGSITLSETKYGILFTPHLHGLTPGIHGFHVHQNPSCADNGMAAGGHFDPKNTGKHLGPYNDNGHLGDLPAMYVNADGTVTLPVLAPRIKHIKDLKKHSLMLHEGGDNYSDEPSKLGGGGMRMVCGVIK